MRCSLFRVARALSITSATAVLAAIVATPPTSRAEMVRADGESSGCPIHLLPDGRLSGPANEGSGFPGRAALLLPYRDVGCQNPTPMIEIDHPRTKNKGARGVPPRFIAAVKICGVKKADVTVTASVAPKVGGAPVTPGFYLKKGRPQDKCTTHSRHVLSFNINPPPAANTTYVLTVNATVTSSGVVLTPQTVEFEVTKAPQPLTRAAVPDKKRERNDPGGIIQLFGGPGITIPSANDYPITGDDLQDFYAYGPVDSGRTVIAVTIDGIHGNPTTDDSSDPTNPMWYGEFFNLYESPGPGTGYQIVATDDLFQPTPYRTVDIESR